MRLFPLLCSFVLLAGPACGQQLALTPAAKPECPPTEPDSLQISWTAPCDKGDWLSDTQTGCRMWDWHPEPEDKAVWNGACRDGKREGPGHYRWNDSVSFEGSYANDVPQGQGTLRLDDVVLSGEWNKG